MYSPFPVVWIGASCFWRVLLLYSPFLVVWIGTSCFRRVLLLYSPFLVVWIGASCFWRVLLLYSPFLVVWIGASCSLGFASLVRALPSHSQQGSALHPRGGPDPLDSHARIRSLVGRFALSFLFSFFFFLFSFIFFYFLLIFLRRVIKLL